MQGLSQFSPWIAVVAVLISGLALLVSTRHAQKQERLRLEFKTESDQVLQELKAKSEQALQRLKAELDKHAESARSFVRLNEENWRRVLEGIRALKKAGFAMTASFRTLANHAHSHIEISEDQLVSESLAALKRHEEFRVALQDLRAEIRPKDYEDLSKFLKYLIIVFLDVGRTSSERTAKAAQMKKHEKILMHMEQRFQKMIEHFLLPYRVKE